MPMVPGCQRPPIPTPTGQAVYPSNATSSSIYCFGPRHPLPTPSSTPSSAAVSNPKNHTKPLRCPSQSLPPSTVKQIVKLCSHGSQINPVRSIIRRGSTMSTKLITSHGGCPHTLPVSRDLPPLLHNCPWTRKGSSRLQRCPMVLPWDGVDV